MEIREVKIEEYWPLIVKGTAEFGQIAAALNPEFNKLAECIYRVLNESFIQDASEYGVSRWESILGITPAAGATLDDRKAAILTYMNIKLPYTWRVLKQMLVPILGGEDKFVMEYLNDEAKLVLHTDRLNDAMLATVTALLERVLPQNIEVERYNHHIEVSWREINKYAECVTPQELYEVDPEKNTFDTAKGYQTYDICSDGTFPYITKLTSVDSGGTAYGSNMFDRAFASIDKPLTLSMPNLKDWGGGSTLTELILDAPNLTTFHEVYSLRIRRIKCNSKKIKYATHLCWAGTLEVLECEFPELTTGSMTANAKLNKESALRVFNTIPNYTTGSHPLEIGIHVDHQHDEEVLEAIANAEAKGWTLTVRWNGTPTSGVSTTDLEEIYAKVTILDEEHAQYGEYVNESGNRCTLEWGHYVTDTTEYKLFYSLVEAEQYFKLTKVNENE